MGTSDGSEETIHSTAQQQQEEEDETTTTTDGNGTHHHHVVEEEEEEEYVLAQEFESLVLQANTNQHTHTQEEEEEQQVKSPFSPSPSPTPFQDQHNKYNATTHDYTPKILCKYFRTQAGCRYGDACRYKHAAPKLENDAPELNFLGLPVRPSEQECAFYLRTGSCGYGPNCRFHHPDPTAVKEYEPEHSMTNVRGSNGYPKMYANEPYQSSGASRGIPDLSNGINMMNGLPYVTMNSYQQAIPQNNGLNQDKVNLPLPAKNMPLPHQIFNYSKKVDPSTQYEQVMQSEEFPLRPGQPDCDYFMKTGDCKYRTACRFNHPVTRSAKLRLPQLSSRAVHSKSKNHEPPSLNPVNARKHGTSSHQHPKILNGTYPERPGVPECEFFLKTGNCKFKAACKYHHPKDRISTPSSHALNEAGFPLRPGARICRNYEQQGTCKYGQNCLFNHPDNVSPEMENQGARDAIEDENHSSSNAVVPIALESPSNNMGSDWGDGWVL